MIKSAIRLLFLICLYVAPVAAQDKTLPSGDFTSLRFMGIAKVSQIIDPQTLQLQDGRLVRLAGLNFPDYKLHEPGDISVVAIKILRDLLEGQDVNLYQTKKKDRGRTNRMGHHIAHLERKNDKAWVQGALISLGLAQVRTTKRNPEMATQMYELENMARKESRGIWEGDTFGILAPEDTESHLGSFQITEGRIESAAIKKNRIYLNFGKDWRSDFTVSIAPMDRRSFSKEGLDPLQWNGKTVRVRGWLESYNGPYMEINHPQAIEIIDKNQAPEDDSNKGLPEQNRGPMVKSIETNN